MTKKKDKEDYTTSVAWHIFATDIVYVAVVVTASRWLSMNDRAAGLHVRITCCAVASITLVGSVLMTLPWALATFTAHSTFSKHP